jgi:hypothetical protein
MKIKIRFINLIYLSVLFIFASSCYNYTKNNEQFELLITQIVYGGDSQQEYLLVNNKLIIKEKKYNQSSFHTKKTINLKKEEIDTIKYFASQILYLEKKYIKGSLGGIYWEIHISMNNKNNNIILENVQPNEIYLLFQKINILIKNKKYTLHKLD